jgi:hypothetical protein
MSSSEIKTEKTRRWMAWQPRATTTPGLRESEPTKPSKAGFVGFEGPTSTRSSIVLGRRAEPASQWPAAAMEYGQRFGERHARLFPLLGRKVWTPQGSGTLIQVFANSVTVLLDSELSRCSFFAPTDIEPIACEVPE